MNKEMNKQYSEQYEVFAAMKNSVLYNFVDKGQKYSFCFIE